MVIVFLSCLVTGQRCSKHAVKTQIYLSNAHSISALRVFTLSNHTGVLREIKSSALWLALIGWPSNLFAACLWPVNVSAHLLSSFWARKEFTCLLALFFFWFINLFSFELIHYIFVPVLSLRKPRGREAPLTGPLGSAKQS